MVNKRDNLEKPTRLKARSIKFSDDDWDAICEAAGRASLSPSALMREIILGHLADDRSDPLTHTDKRKLARTIHAVWHLLSEEHLDNRELLARAAAEAKKRF